VDTRATEYSYGENEIMKMIGVKSEKLSEDELAKFAALKRREAAAWEHSVRYRFINNTIDRRF